MHKAKKMCIPLRVLRDLEYLQTQGDNIMKPTAAETNKIERKLYALFFYLMVSMTRKKLTDPQPCISISASP